MNRYVIAGSCALLLLAGCSTKESTTESTSGSKGAAADTNTATDTAGNTPPSEAPAAAHVKFGNSDAGPITSVACQTDGGLTTITIDAARKTTVVLTDDDAPVVKSVSIGEAGADGPSLMFLEGVSAPPQATRDGKRYSVTGSGMGTDSADAPPVETQFDIALSCP